MASTPKERPPSSGETCIFPTQTHPLRQAHLIENGIYVIHICSLSMQLVAGEKKQQRGAN